jgi:hypothetical protein
LRSKAPRQITTVTKNTTITMLIGWSPKATLVVVVVVVVVVIVS